MTEQKFTLGTVVSGLLNVVIEGVGSLETDFSNLPLQGYAGNVYCYLIGQTVLDSGNLFQLVFFDPVKRELVVRVNR